MKNLLIVSAVFLLLTACSNIRFQKPIEIQTKPTERPPLVLPTVDKFTARNVEWIVVTPENIDEVFKQMEESQDNIVLFALTDNGYENLSLNMAEITKLIKQQRSIIAAYKQYYEEEQ